MISKKEVSHIAKLARLKLTEEELEKYSRELSVILDYVRELEKVKTEGVSPTSHPLEISLPLRKDEIRPQELEKKEKLLRLAPLREGNFIKTLGVFKKHEKTK